MSESVTPFAEAVELLKSGTADKEVHARLRARGLDAEEIALLMTAVRARGADAAAPVSEWTESPVSADAGSAPAAERTGITEDSPEGTCSRCGTFITRQTLHFVLARPYCASCAARPDINYPKAFRDKYWAKRDAWAWFYGMLGLLSVLGGTVAVANGAVIGLLTIGIGVVEVLFWAAWKPSRALLVMTTLAVLPLGGGLLAGVVNLAFAIAAIRNTRHKLFFEIEPTEAELFIAWSNASDNRIARWGQGLAVVAGLSMLTWCGTIQAAWVTAGIGLMAVATSGIGLRRVNPEAVPPVGQRTAALLGLVVGAIAVIGSLLFLGIGSHWTKPVPW